MEAEDTCQYVPESGFLSYPQWYLEYKETNDSGFVFDVKNDSIENKNLVYDFKPFFSDGFRSDKDGNIWTSAGKGIKCFYLQFYYRFVVINHVFVPQLYLQTVEVDYLKYYYFYHKNGK